VQPLVSRHNNQLIEDYAITTTKPPPARLVPLGRSIAPNSPPNARLALRAARRSPPPSPALYLTNLIVAMVATWASSSSRLTFGRGSTFLAFDDRTLPPAYGMLTRVLGIASAWRVRRHPDAGRTVGKDRLMALGPLHGAGAAHGPPRF